MGGGVCPWISAPVAFVYIVMYIANMPRRYSIAEARSRLPSLIDEAEAGIEVELTRRGRPVAVLVSHREFERLRGTRSQFNEAYCRFLERYSLDDIGVDRGFAASIRDRTVGRKVSM